MSRTGLACILAVALHSGCFFFVSGDEHEYRLTKYLLSNYESSVRPVANSSQPIIVFFGMSIHHIIDVDERNQILTINCWLDQTWNDTHLTWNASDFGGITTIGLPYDKVWRPDIILYNNADSGYNTAVINTNVMVSSKGEVKWLSHGIFKSSCDISVEYFPFDVQVCKMKWASWTYDALGLDLFSPDGSEGDVTNYHQNGEFKLESFRALKSYVNYSCCANPFPDITFYIELRRRPMFYVFNLILPCLLINGIALLVFYVPSESGEKVTLGISALLSMTVFLMTIRESLPPTEKTPLISLYYGVSICLVSFASAMAVVTLNIHHRGLRGSEVPFIIKRYVLKYLSRVVLLNFEVDEDHEEANGGCPTATNSSKLSQTHNPTTSTTETSLKDFAQTNEENVSMTFMGSNGNIIGNHHPSTFHPHQFDHAQPRVVSFASCPFEHLHSAPATSSYCINSQGMTCPNRVKRPSFGSLVDHEMQQPQPQPSSLNECPANYARYPGSVGQCCNVPVMVCSPPIVNMNEAGRRRGCDCRTGLDVVLNKISQTIDESRERARCADRSDQSALEWKKVSLVVDRLLLLVFFLAMTIASFVILTSSPHLY